MGPSRRRHEHHRPVRRLAPALRHPLRDHHGHARRGRRQRRRHRDRPALGLRRENEDRVAHYRSGTVDIFNLDRVDFFYNQSAPLTQFFWGHDETLRRVMRVIRMTQPDIYIGFTPTLGAGHGNHQQAGRFIWEGMLAAADPTHVPGSADGPARAQHLAGQEGLLRRQHRRHRRHDRPPPTAPPASRRAARTSTTSPASGPATTRRTCGRRAMSRAGRPDRRRSGRRSRPRAAPPTRRRAGRCSRTPRPGCSRFGMTDSFVPFQPNANPDGTANPLAGQDDAILYGAVVQDPGGLPLGTLEYLSFSRFYNVAGAPFTATLHVTRRRGTRSRPARRAHRPERLDGRRGEAGRRRSPPARRRRRPSRSRPRGRGREHELPDLRAVPSGANTGYTDDVVRVVPAAEGRFHRWGNWAEFDSWLQHVAPRRTGSAARPRPDHAASARPSRSPSTSTTGPTRPQTGTVTLDAAGRRHGRRDDASRTARSRRGADTTVNFPRLELVHERDAADQRSPDAGDAQNTNVTSGSRPRRRPGTGSEDLTLGIVPKTSIPEAATAPAVDGIEGAASTRARRSTSAASGSRAAARATARRSASTAAPRARPGRRTARTPRSRAHGDDLYFFVHVRDDFQSYAVTPAECVGHWQADSVEILIDPRGNASQRLKDTAYTFKLGVFPFTNDPSGSNGNGVNGPCWERDADNHQGYATGPLAATVDDAPNAPGVQVASTAHLGRQQRRRRSTTPTARRRLRPRGQDPDGRPAGGRRPRPHGPEHHAVRRRQHARRAGTTDAAPHRPEHAPRVVDVRQRPVRPVPLGPRDAAGLHAAGGPADDAGAAERLAPEPGRRRVAADDLPVGAQRRADLGPRPRAGERQHRDQRARARHRRRRSRHRRDRPGTAHVFLWTGDHGAIPVFTTSCDAAADPPPDYGLTRVRVDRRRRSRRGRPT